MHWGASIAAIKRKYDPQNLFHHNANIQPAQAGGRPDNRSDISMLRAGSGSLVTRRKMRW